MGLKAVGESTRERVKQMILCGCGSTEITIVTGVSRGYVCTVARRLGVKLPRPGCRRATPMVILTCDWCEKKYHRPERVIRGERSRRGTDRIGQYCSARCFRQSQGYSQRDIATLRKLQPTHSNAEIAAIVGRTPGAVATMLSNLGLLRRDTLQYLVRKLRKEAENADRKTTRITRRPLRGDRTG